MLHSELGMNQVSRKLAWLGDESEISRVRERVGDLQG